MPRRPRKQPRGSNGFSGAKKSPGPVKKSDASIKKWVRREDIDGDDEDNFHTARDRILLEGDEASDDLGDGEEEVFGLGLDDDVEEEKDDDEGEPAGPEDSVESEPPRKPKKKSAPEPKASSSGSDSEELESWGRTKSAYYASNSEFLPGKEGEEGAEEANEMEEQEARRLQARIRENMTDEDYGLYDMVDGSMDDASMEVEATKRSAVLPAPGVHLEKAAALRHLEKNSPETLALSREWDDVVRDLIRVQGRLDILESTTPDALSLGLSHLHHQTLLTYVTTLAFYLHLRASTSMQASQTQPSTRIKQVLSRLLTLKQALATMEELDFDASDSDLSDFEEDGLSELESLVQGDMNRVWGKRSKPLEEGELEALLQDADSELVPRKNPTNKTKKDSSNTSETKLANGVHRKKSGPKLAFDLEEPEFVATSSVTKVAGGGLEAYGEVSTLSMADDADKRARKRTLRFHTNKIETSARRKEEARERIGGDDDIPYHERRKEKEARLRREVDKTRGKGGEDLNPEGDVEMEDVDAGAKSGKRKRDEKDLADMEEGEDGYYELVKRTKQVRKESKQQQYEEVRTAQRLGVVAEEDASGQRSLTRAILKNKGLTPHRSKSVRNPRVKKRERYEKAKKKVRSQKAVFKGGLAGKPYGGEESGITKVVKSVKL